MSMSAKTVPRAQVGFPSLRGLKGRVPNRPKLYRGAIVNPYRGGKHEYFPEGGLAVDAAGKIAAVGNFKEVQSQVGSGFEVVDNTTHGETPILIPAFSDLHTHWVQYEVRGQFGGALLPWLREHIWPEETKYHDSAFAQEKALLFFKALIRQGTAMAVIYSSIHAVSLRAAFRSAIGYAIIGNVVMTQNSPPGLLQEPQEAMATTNSFSRSYGSSYAVTPRFAPTCSAEVLARLAQIAQRHRTWIQTHLSENEEEVRWVKKLFPEAASYTDVYCRAGLLGPRTILGHAIHLSDEELRLLTETRTNIAHCPTSNKELASGRMPLERIKEAKIPFALGSDVGAGPSLSMLHVMQGYLSAHRPSMRVTATEALYRATLAGAEILGLDKVGGNFAQGKDGNFVLLKSPGTNPPSSADDLLEAVLRGDQSDLENMAQETFLRGIKV